MGSSCSLLDSEQQQQQQQQQHPRKKGHQQQQQRRKKSSTAASSSTTNNNNNISTSVSSPAHRNRSFLKRDFTLEKSGRRDPSTANVTSGIESQQQQQAPNPLDANSVRIAAAAAGSSSQAPVKSPQHSQQQQQSLIEAQPRSSTPVEIADTTEYPPTIATIERNDLVMGAASSSPPPPQQQQQQQQQQQLFMPVESALFSGGDPVGLVADDPSQFVVPSVSTHRFSVSQNSTATRQTTQRHSVSTVMEEGLHLSDSAPPHYQQHRSSVGSNVVVAAAAAAPLPPPPSMLTGVAGPISSVSPQGAAIVNDFSGIVDPFICSVSAFDTAGKSGQEFSSLSLGEQRQLQQQQRYTTGSAVPDSPHPSSSNEMLSAEALGRPLAVSPLKPLVSITTADVGGGSVVIDELPSFANETVPLPKAPPRLSSTANPPTKDRRDGSPPMQEGQKHRNKQLRPLSAKRTNSNLFSMADRTDSRSNGGGGGNNPTQLQATIIISKAALLKPSFNPTRSSAETSSRSIILAVFLNPKAEEAISNWIDTCDQGKGMPLSDPQLSHKVA